MCSSLTEPWHSDDGDDGLYTHTHSQKGSLISSDGHKIHVRRIISHMRCRISYGLECYSESEVVKSIEGRQGSGHFNGLSYLRCLD